METVGIHDEPTLRGQQDHTHAPNRDESVRRKAEHDTREKAKSGTASIPAIYDEVAKTVHRHFASPRRTEELLIQSKAKCVPKLPQTVADLQGIPPVFANTGQKHDIRFLLNNSSADGNEGSIVMATDFCISLLGEKKAGLWMVRLKLQLMVRLKFYSGSRSPFTSCLVVQSYRVFTASWKRAARLL